MTTPTLPATGASARALQVAISAQAMRDVTRMWPMLDVSRLNATFPAWLRAMITLIRSYHQQSSTAAASFYREVRAEATRSHAPASLIRMAQSPTDEWLTQAFGFSGPGMLSRDKVRPNTALSTTLGTASRIVLDGGRSTVGLTVAADPVAVGWYLLTDSDPCSWCAMIASRGVVYRKDSLARSNAKFVGNGTAKLHNHCHCILAPAFSHDQPLPLINQEAADVYANRGEGPALQAFRKAWDGRKSPGGQVKSAPARNSVHNDGLSREQIAFQIATLTKQMLKPDLSESARAWQAKRLAELYKLLDHIT